MSSRFLNHREEDSVILERKWRPHVHPELMVAVTASSESKANGPLQVVGPAEAPLAALLPPLPAGLASIRVSFATTNGSLDSRGGGDWVTSECRGCLWVGPSQLEPAKLIGTVGKGAGNALDDHAGLSRQELGAAPVNYGGLGFTSAWFDVDGDGQLDAIVAQREEERWLDTNAVTNDGAVHVVFLDWKNRLDGERIDDWRTAGARVR